MKLALSLFISLLSVSVASEPSVFRNQNATLDSKNLQEIANFTRSVSTDFQNRITDLEQYVDGLRKAYEPLSRTIKQNSDSLRDYMSKVDSLERAMKSYRDIQDSQVRAIDELKKQISINTNNIKQLNDKLDKLSGTFLKVNQELVSQLKTMNEQIQSLQDSLKNIQEIQKKREDEYAKDKAKENKIIIGDNIENLKQAKNLFRRGKYNDSQILFEHLIDNNFEVAQSNFYIGEIYYARRAYKDALPYYKNSASMDSKASYMPILLWHTAWSFKYLNDDNNYRKFLETLVTLFPNSEQGIRAKNILKK